jgi:hypothetical protein
MRMSPQSLFIIIILTFITGFTDARGFMHASAMWNEGGFVPAVAVKAVAYFALGIPMYMATLYFLRRHGVVVAELQVMFWFMVTVIGVGLMSGRFLTWTMADRMVATLVVAGMVWLVVRVGA